MAAPKVSLGTHAKLWLEHWFYGTVLSAVVSTIVVLIQSGKHDYANVSWSLLLGLALPLIEKPFPNSALNKASKVTGIPTSVLTAITSQVQGKLADELIKREPAGVTSIDNSSGASQINAPSVIATPTGYIPAQQATLTGTAQAQQAAS